MSLYSGKTVLVLGNLPQSTEEVLDELKKFGVSVVDVADLSSDVISSVHEVNPDLLLINTTSNFEQAVSLLSDLQKTNSHTKYPILAYITETDNHIKRVLENGAADYCTAADKPTLVHEKIRLLFGHSNNFAGSVLLHMPQEHIRQVSHEVKVFAVEDDQLVRNLLTVKFDQANFSYAFSHGDQNMLSELKKFSPNIILLDLKLPDRDGLEVLAEIKSDKDISNIPVVVFTNRDEELDVKEAYRLGVVAFNTKVTTNLSDLVHQLQDLV